MDDLQKLLENAGVNEGPGEGRVRSGVEMTGLNLSRDGSSRAQIQEMLGKLGRVISDYGRYLQSDETQALYKYRKWILGKSGDNASISRSDKEAAEEIMKYYGRLV